MSRTRHWHIYSSEMTAKWHNSCILSNIHVSKYIYMHVFRGGGGNLPNWTSQPLSSSLNSSLAYLWNNFKQLLIVLVFFLKEKKVIDCNKHTLIYLYLVLLLCKHVTGRVTVSAVCWGTWPGGWAGSPSAPGQDCLALIRQSLLHLEDKRSLKIKMKLRYMYV